MRRAERWLLVAATELAMALRSKAFIIGMMMVPVMIGIAVGFQRLSQYQTDREDRRFAVIDETGVLYRGIADAAAQWNSARDVVAAPPGAHMFPEAVSDSRRTADATRRDLVARVQKRDLKAFIEIPSGAIDGSAPIRYFAQSAADTTLPRWLENTINREILSERFRRADVDRAQVSRLTKPVPLSMLSLPVWDARGVAREPAPVDFVRAQGVPLAVMMLLLFVVITSAPALMNSVLEEKLSRTNELMLGSVSAFEFMAGKLLGAVAVSLIVASVYLAAVIVIARAWGYADVVTPRLVASFVFYSILAELLFGAVFIAIGAACADLKDTQTMMTPVMLALVLPAFVLPAVIRAPASTFAVTMSLVPLFTPFLMLPLTTITPTPPLWQQGAGIALTIATTVLFVWAAGRIFRVGLLAHGRSASVADMLRWIRIG